MQSDLLQTDGGAMSLQAADYGGEVVMRQVFAGVVTDRRVDALDYSMKEEYGYGLFS
jgi:hypothetical protein